MVTELMEGVYWVGIVDWGLRKFHGHELSTHRGSTYNSYLIRDEKTVLVDTAWAPFKEEWLENIRAVVDPAKIDIVVANHAEPDHSGGLPLILQHAPNAELIVSKRGAESLEGIYHKPWKFRTVKTGDRIPIGKSELVFIEATMLHWPDSMFTYVREAKTLLPNDAFGQHLASSKRFADEVDINVVMEEASKYYANILMPFGGQIQRMLAKIEELGLEIEAIGPSHGVTWRRPEDVARILEAYAGWSGGRAPERVTLIYDTMWHSTEKMTMAIADGVAQEGVECSVLKLSVSPRSEAAHQILESRAFLVGGPTLNNGIFPSVGGFLTYIKGLRPKNRIAGAYGSCGWAGGAVKQVDAELRELGLDVLDPIEVKYMPAGAEIDACMELGREVARRVKALGD